MGPIFRSLLKNKLGAILIVLQIAMTVAILANVASVVSDRIEHISRQSGVVEAEIATFRSARIDPNQDAIQSLAAEREVLKGIPGIASVAASNTIVFSNSGWSTGMRADLKPEARNDNVAIYMSTAGTIETLGLKLIAGRDFDPREVTAFKRSSVMDPPVIIITETVAKTYFPDGDALGKRVTVRGDASVLGSEIIGIVSDLDRPWVGWGKANLSVLVPYVDGGGAYRLILRIAPGQDVRAVTQQARDALAARFRDSIYSETVETMSDLRREAFSTDVALTVLVSSFALLMLGVTVLGMIGLASFWVTQRTRTIGVRRALGARAVDIERYFRAENALLSASGGILGIGLAYALNFALSKLAGMDLLPVMPAILGVLVLLAVGQLAVTWPARAASRIPPALATRAA